MAIDNKTLDALIHAFLDGQLSPDATKKVVKYLKEHPKKNEELKLNKKVKTYLSGAFDPILDLPVSKRLQAILTKEQNVVVDAATGTAINVDEVNFDAPAEEIAEKIPPKSKNRSTAVPEKIAHDSRQWQEVVSAGLHSHSGHIVLVSAIVFLLGLAIGYLYPRPGITDKIDTHEFADNLVLSAHKVFSSEKALALSTPQANLSEFTKLYSSKIGADVSPVNLKGIGLDLVGAQLLPSLSERAVFYMYQSVSNERLSLYIRKHVEDTGVSGYHCYASQSSRLNICTWRGKKLTYYVVSDQPADTMEAIVQDMSTQLTH